MGVVDFVFVEFVEEGYGGFGLGFCGCCVGPSLDGEEGGE